MMRSSGSSARETRGFAVRIIGGLAKGRRLKAPHGLVTRPMTDRVREALFSSIADLTPGADVLDLYAGTGSLGLEALSRGASSAVFVERHPGALRSLRENVNAVGLGGCIAPMDVSRFLARRRDRIEQTNRELYDLAFVDPPYLDTVASVERIMRLLGPFLQTSATVIVHRRTGENMPDAPGFCPEGSRIYGTTCIWRYSRVPIVQD